MILHNGRYKFTREIEECEEFCAVSAVCSLKTTIDKQELQLQHF